MKKLICILLAFILVFSMTACFGFGGGDDDNTDNNNNNDNDDDSNNDAPKKDLKGFITAVESTNPVETVVETTVKTQAGDLNSRVETTYNKDGSFTLEYSYDKINEFGEGDGFSTTVTGTIECDKNGNYSGAVDGKISSATAIKLKLDNEALFNNLQIADDMFSATILAKNTKTVLGISISDAEIIVSKSKGKITTLSIAYADGEGNPVSISCEYH